jgi:membrane-bound metal-dependent hydrolase YbcI (DUF457 family)
MPSPIAHLTAGYVVYRLASHRWPALDTQRLGPLPRLLVITAGLSVLPDADSALGLLAGDFGRYHNNATHSLLVGLAVALTFGVWMYWRQRHGLWPWFVVALASYDLHVLMDSATVGRGVMAFWPLSASRYQAPWALFYGLHWSEGWLSSRHLWTLVTELAFMALVLVIVYRVAPRLAAARKR